MAREQIGSNATFTSVGQTVSYIGKHLYAYSGQVGVDNAEKDLLSFSTGKQYSMAKLVLGSNAGENEDYRVKVMFNDIVVYSNLFLNQGQDFVVNGPMIPLLLPPLTLIVVSLTNTADADNRTWTAHIIGEVYS